MGLKEDLAKRNREAKARFDAEMAGGLSSPSPAAVELSPPRYDVAQNLTSPAAAASPAVMENPPSALSVNEYEEDWSQFASNKYAEMAARDPLSPKGMKAHPSQDQVVRRFTKLEEEISGAMVEPYRSVGEKSYVTPLCALRSEYEVGEAGDAQFEADTKVVTVSLLIGADLATAKAAVESATAAMQAETAQAADIVSQKIEEGFKLAELLFERTALAGKHIAHKGMVRAWQGAKDWLSGLLQRWRRKASPTTHAKQMHHLAKGWSTVVWVESQHIALQSMLANWRHNKEECHFRRVTATLEYELRHAMWFGRKVQQGHLSTLLDEAEALGRESLGQVRALTSLKQELALAQAEARRAAAKAAQRDGLLQLMTDSGVTGANGAGVAAPTSMERVGAADEGDIQEGQFSALTRSLQATRLLQRLGAARDAAALNRCDLKRCVMSWCFGAQQAQLQHGIRVGLQANQVTDEQARGLAMKVFQRHGPGARETQGMRCLLQRWAFRSHEAAMHSVVALLGEAAAAHETDWRIKEQKGLLQGQEAGRSETTAAITDLEAQCEAEEGLLQGLRRQLVSLQHDKESLTVALAVYQKEIQEATATSDTILQDVLRIEQDTQTLEDRKAAAVVELQRLEDGSAINEIQAMIDARLPALRDVEWEWDEVSARHEDLRKKVAKGNEEAAELKVAYQGLQEENTTMRAAIEAEQQILDSVQCEVELVKLDLETAQANLASERGIRDEVTALYEASKLKLAEVNAEMVRVDGILEEQQKTLRLKMESVAELQSEIIAMLPPGLGIREDLFETNYWKEALGDAVEAQLRSLQGVQQQLAELEAEQAALIETAAELEADFTRRNAAIAEAEERKFLQVAQAEKLEAEAAASELRLNQAQNALSRLHAEMGLTEAEHSKILHDMTTLTEQQQSELGKMRDLAAEIARTEEQTASVSFEAAQAKAKHNHTVAEKDKITAVLSRELQELEELHGDLKSTAIVSGSVQRELEQTRLVLASAKVELQQVSVAPISPQSPVEVVSQAPSPASTTAATAAPEVTNVDDILKDATDALAAPMPSVAVVTGQDEAYADPVLAKARRLLDAPPGPPAELNTKASGEIAKVDDLLEEANNALASPTTATAETGATLAEALAPPSPTETTDAGKSIVPSGTGSRSQRLSSRKGFLGHARAKYGL